MFFTFDYLLLTLWVKGFISEKWVCLCPVCFIGACFVAHQLQSQAFVSHPALTPPTPPLRAPCLAPQDENRNSHVLKSMLYLRCGHADDCPHAPTSYSTTI